MEIDREHVARWVDGYERAWRAGDTYPLAEFFTPDVRYRRSPWTEPLYGLDDLKDFWERTSEEPYDRFDMTSEVVAVDGNVAVVRVSVEYDDAKGGRWRDLWLLRFGPDGRCTAFEEWPFAPGQPDGHEAPG